MKNFDTMLVGFDHSHGDPAVLIVGRKAPGDNVRIINQFQGREAGEGLKSGELISQPNPGHSQSLLYKGLMEAVAVVMVLSFVQAVQLVADRLMAHHFFVHWFIPPE